MILARLAAFAPAILILLAPALWNGFPLLQYDTGGYLARWYEGHLEESRSTVFGLYLAAGASLDFWPNVILQAALTVWIVTLVLRVLDVQQGACRLTAVIFVLSLATALPWLTSLLLTDIFAGLGMLALYLVVFQWKMLRPLEGWGLCGVIAFSAASHSATFAVFAVLLFAGFSVWFIFRTVPGAGLGRGCAATLAGAVLLLATNLGLSGQLAWTPGGYGLAFGRILQDGIVARYLDDHCPQRALKLCPYRDRLPTTADEFFWGQDLFDRLGRFEGLGDEMRTIVRESVATYPWLHAKAAVIATLRQLVMVATGEGVHAELWHTQVTIRERVPEAAPAMATARQQQGHVGFGAINALHVPVALASTLFVFAAAGWALWLRRRDDFSGLATAAALALLANAAVCGVFSGPHDRYGARLVWIATLVLLVAVLRASAGLRLSEEKL